MNNQPKYEIWTMANSGMVNITSRSIDKLGFMDMITLVELEMWNSEALTLMQNINDNNNFFAFLIYEPVTVFDVYLFINKTSPLLYLDPTSYTIDKNKIIIAESVIIAAGVADPQNPTITMRYTFNPVYVVLEINRDLIKQKNTPDCSAVINKVDFPLKCVGKLAHLVLTAPNYNGVGLIDNTNYSRIPPIY
jgi:hypothetical protein